MQDQLPQVPHVRYSQMDSDEIAQNLRTKWQAVTRTVDVLISAVEEGKIEKEDAYPAIPLAIAAVTSSIFGFTPRTGFTEVGTLTSESLINQSLATELLNRANLNPQHTRVPA